ncbi:uncharacterized protein LODBEIA_P39960 [Lodderomyces beijingensis]|uniref:Peptidase A1 domain-containing protein n=1 Tax=Lodderomyces beijingensis TaxID=1775926 RepID=A0ABP0ZR04_9ASCO
MLLLRQTVSLLILLPTTISFKLDFQIHQVQHDKSLAKRDVTAPFRLDKNVYLTQLELGSNHDRVTVSLDTGSPDLWVMSKSAQCFNVSDFHTLSRPHIPELFDDLDSQYSCTANGTFDYQASATFQEKKVEPDFRAGFADGSAATGIWGVDDVHLGGDVTLRELKFGIANASSIDVGILGLGPQPENERGFVALLKEQGVINRTMYSIYMNSSSGSIVFGSELDESKYAAGQMATASMDQNVGVDVSEVSIDGRTVSAGEKVKVLFDTGSTFSTMPHDWIKILGESLNGTYDEDQMAYQVSCEMEHDAKNFTFKIDSEPEMSLPIRNLIVRAGGGTSCYLGIMDESLIGGAIFGADILQHFYTVYDLQEEELSIAPLKLGASASSDAGSGASSSTGSGATESSRSHSGASATLRVYCISMIPLSIYIFFIY